MTAPFSGIDIRAVQTALDALQAAAGQLAAHLNPAPDISPAYPDIEITINDPVSAKKRAIEILKELWPRLKAAREAQSAATITVIDRQTLPETTATLVERILTLSARGFSAAEVCKRLNNGLPPPEWLKVWQVELMLALMGAAA